MLKPIKIGNITIKHPVLLAPMCGVTDYPFRCIVQSFEKVGLMFSEMVASRALLQSKEKALNMCKSDFDIKSIQIAGNDPEYMIPAAKMAEEMGAEILDLNFGCPVKKVVNGHAGSALMKDPDLSRKIINAVVNAVKIPVTVKMRMGWDCEHLNAPEIARIAEGEGAQMVTVHGRTRSQMYEGNANWKFIAEVKKAVSIPVIANGDINSVENAMQALEDSGADGVMVARGIYGRPWLIRQMIDKIQYGTDFPEPTLQEKYELACKHFLAMVEHHGEELAISLARKHIAWYSSGMSGSASFRSSINRITNKEEFLLAIKNFWSNGF